MTSLRGHNHLFFGGSRIRTQESQGLSRLDTTQGRMILMVFEKDQLHTLELKTQHLTIKNHCTIWAFSLHLPIYFEIYEEEDF